MADPGSDAELLRRCRRGDPEGFAELVRRYEDRLYNVCLRVLGDPQDASDATQEAFLSAFRALDRFREESAVTTWLHRIAVNSCYDILRAKRRRPQLHVLAEDEGLHDREPPSPDHADDVAAAIDVQAALNQVPEEFRAALVLADVQDLPYDEIARILDVPVGTVKSRVHRGRVALARALTRDSSAGREPDPVANASEDER
jgi:RNA polymerase sigma-70 factor (ECF subfamily)